MPLSSSQQKHMQEWVRSRGITRCPACGKEEGWRFDEAAYVNALLEAGDMNLTEDRGVVKVACGGCGYVMLFDAETIGIRGLWSEGRGL